MAFSKNLFLGVYASSATIRALFLPLCYVFLASPFALLGIRYYGVDHLLYEYIPATYKRPEAAPQLFITLVAILLVTRLVSGNRHGAIQKGGKRRVQLLPYWIPGLRHCANVVFGGQNWMKDVSDSNIDNIIGYNLAGAKHTLVLLGSLLQAIARQGGSLAETDVSRWIIPRNAFSMPKDMKEQYLDLRPAISDLTEEEVFGGKQMKKIVQNALAILSQSLPDLITFNTSLVDQMQWERVADIELTKGTEEVECKLFDLVNEFFCNAIIAPITGAQFPESYQLLATDLATFNQFYYVLALGFPRLFPMPGLPTAALARKRLLQNLRKLFNDLSNAPVKQPVKGDESDEETDADEPTALTAMNKLFMKHNVPLAARASITLELLHSIVAEVVPLGFWTLLHVYSQSTRKADADLLSTAETPIDRIRQETDFWADAVQPPSIHESFPAPPEITFTSVDELFTTTPFPYLASCIKEARRLYSSSLAMATIAKPITITESHTARPGNELEWTLDPDTYIDIGISQTLINTSAANHLVPEQFIPDRFINLDSRIPSSVSPFDSAEPLTNALLTAFVAGVVQLWDISAAPKKGFFDHLHEAQAAAAGAKPSQVQEGKKDEKVGVWVIPKAVDGAEVRIPKGEVRVRIRRREGLEAPKAKTLTKTSGDTKKK